MKSARTLATIILSAAFSSLLAQAFNMTMESNWDNPNLPMSGGLTYNDCWGYNAPNGTEVAILGALQRVYFFDVSDPSDPEIIDWFLVQNSNATTNSSIWRDFKVYDHYAYASADQGTSGLLIFDLQYVPDSVVLVNQTQEFWDRTHNIWIDVEHGRLYAAGPNTNSQGLIVLDLTENPEDPTEIGSPVLPLGYVHDVHVVDNIAYASHGSDQALTIYDFTDADDPEVIRTLEDYPQPGYNHSSWLDATGNRLIFADETHGRALKCVNPNLSEHQTTNYHTFKSNLLQNNNNSIAHNPFIKGDLAYIAYYHEGVQIFDISDTNDIERIAYYDTYSNTNYNGYEGCWGVYPFLESGFIIASDISNGLFILSLNDVLPVEILSFDASKSGSNVRLEWKIATPEDGDEFITEHSRDGLLFEAVGKIPSERSTLQYTSTHQNPGPGRHFYRLTVLSADGASKSTEIREVFFNVENGLQISPSIAGELLRVDTEISGELTILSADGKTVFTANAEAFGRKEIPVESFAPGQYFVVLNAGTERFTQSFIRQ